MISDKDKHNTIEGPGFAAFIDLHDSTYAWDQNADIAVEMLKELYKLVEKSADKFEGHIGNFTGDGFLMLFTSVEKSILCLSCIIENWELGREKYVKKYSVSGILLPDNQFLALRTGISFGNFGPFKIKNTIHYAGSGINKAQRCESSSKDFFTKTSIDKLKFPNYVFIDSGAENLILSKSDFSVSGQLEVKFKGYSQTSEVSGKVELESRKHFIYAVWPKKKSVSNNKSADELKKIAFAQSKSDIGDRLLIAAQSVKSGVMLHELSESATGKNRKRLLEETVKVYEDALQVYTLAFSPNNYARVQNSLGNALRDQGELLVGEDKKEKLEESIAAQKEALKVYTKDTSPEDYVSVQISIGSALRNQTGLFCGEEKEEKFNEAIKVYKEALSVITLEASSSLYALAHNNLGNVFRIQAKTLIGKEKREKIQEAIKAYREALRVYTFESSPEDYGRTQNNLGNALWNEGECFRGKIKSQKFTEAVDAFKEALRVYDFDSAPIYYAGIQNNLAISLKKQAMVVSGKEKAEKLKEAINAYRQALRGYNIDTMPGYYALVNYNLAYVFEEYAKLFKGEESKRKIKKALELYSESLRILSPKQYPEEYNLATRGISRLKSILKNSGIKK